MGLLRLLVTQIAFTGIANAADPRGLYRLSEDVARTGNGAINNLLFADAQAYCLAQRGRLPSARELALELMGEGSVRETQYPEKPFISAEVEQESKTLSAQGYQRVLKTSGSQNVIVVDFYYAPVSLRNDGKIPANNWYQTSSEYPAGLSTYPANYMLWGSSFTPVRQIYNVGTAQAGAVRCMFLTD